MLDLNKNLEQYILEHTEGESELLHELNRQTHLKMLHPRMLSGQLQGRILSMISKMVHPKYILEIGTYTGYSALCLSEGLQDNGKLFSIEIDDERAEFALNYIKKAGLENTIEIRIGDAPAEIQKLDYPFELSFIDGDKVQYAACYELILEKTVPGGYIIADNVLWSGKVIEKINPDDIETKAILEFNSKVNKDSRVENLLLPVRDGLMIMRKK